MSKTAVVMGKPSYIIKPQDGVVVCKIVTYGSLNFLCEPDYCKLKKRMEKRFQIAFYGTEQRFTAVARLHPNDTWDETIGKRIAESKCKRNIYSFYNRMYSEYLKILKEDEKALKNKINNLEFSLKRECKHISNLMQ